MSTFSSASNLTPALNIVPANQASWDDLQTVLGTRGDPARCQCQRYKLSEAEYRTTSVEERAFRLRAQTDCGYADSNDTSGIIAFSGSEPVGWCNVEPRPDFTRLARMPIPWAGRTQDKQDRDVWAATCFVTRVGYRHRGISRALARAAVDFARERGASAIEGYPMITHPGVDITWGELHVGSYSIFAAAGFHEVHHPTKRRFVMRLDFAQ